MAKQKPESEPKSEETPAPAPAPKRPSVRELVMPYLEAATAGDPPKSNSEIAEAVREARPESLTTPASVASIRCVERKKRGDEIVKSPARVGGRSRSSAVSEWVRERVTSEDRSDETLAALLTNKELAAKAMNDGVTEVLTPSFVSHVRNRQRKAGAPVVSSREITAARSNTRLAAAA